MRKLSIILLISLFGFVLLGAKAFAEPNFSESDAGRYVLLMTKADNSKKQIPAMVLDSAQGVVWVCKDVSSADPVWIETDLGQNGDKELFVKKYAANMLEVKGKELKVAATVLDTEEGIIWTCANLANDDAAWIQKDLKSNSAKEITKKGKSRINIKFDNSKDLLY
jgi:hypothetical protein